MATTLIKNGKVISTTGVIAQDVLITDETITALGVAWVLHRGGLRSRHRCRRQVRHPRRHRRAHAHGAAVRWHVRQRHVRDRIARCGVGWRDDHRRHGRAALRRERVRRARRMAPQGRRAMCHRLRLPPDHRRRRRPVAEGHEVPHRARGHHQLQAVHGLPRRVLQRRRPDPEGHADRRRVRRGHHDARRERHRHRRAGATGAGTRRDRPEVPQLHPAVTARGRGHPSCHRAQPRRRQRAALHRAHVGRRRPQRGRRGPPSRSQRVRRDVPAVPVADAGGDARQARIRRREVGVQHTGAQPRPRPRLHRPDGPRSPGRSVEGLAHERARRSSAPTTARSA